MTTSESAPGAVGELADNHRKVEQLLVQLEAMPPMDGQRRIFAGQAVVELARHFVAAEQYLCPALRAHAGDGGVLARQAGQWQPEIEDALRKLEELPFGSPEFEHLLGRLVPRIRERLREERQAVLDRLPALLPPQSLAELNSRIRRMKSAVPTRTYPSGRAPSQENLVVPGPGMVDRVRAVLTGWCRMS